MRRFVIGAALVVACAAIYPNGANAQPSNDNCAGAIEAFLATVTGFTTNATGSTTSSCGINDVNDVWFRFRPSVPGFYRIDTCSFSEFDTTLAVYDGCGGPEIACNDDFCGSRSRVTPFLEGDRDYFIRIAGHNGETGFYSLTIAPANDDCSTATPVLPGWTQGTNAGAPFGSDITPCASADTRDVWYRFTPDCTGDYRIDTCYWVTLDTSLAVYSDCGTTLLACDDNSCGGGYPQSAVTLSLTGGTDYYIRVAGVNNATGDFTLFIGLANDECSGAIPVTEGQYTASNCASMFDSPTPSCTFDPDSHDVWFSYTAPCTGSVSFSTCEFTEFNTSLAVYSSCGGLQLACNDNNFCGVPGGSGVTLTVIGGEDYLIRVGGVDNTVFPYLGSFTLTVSGVTPVNDECINPLSIAAGESVNGCSANATGTDMTSCTTGDTKDVWYRFVPPCDGTYTIDTCSYADFDTSVAVFSSCGGSQLACSDDACGPAPASRSSVTLALTGGTAYLIRVAGENGEGGGFTLSVSAPPPPPNDDCANAIPVSEGTTSGSNCGATGLSTCDGSADVWYSYTPALTGPVVIDTCGSPLDTVLAAYDGCGAMTPLDCNDDDCDVQSSITIPMTGGITYYIRVAGFDGFGTAATGPFDLHVTSLVPTPTPSPTTTPSPASTPTPTPTPVTDCNGNGIEDAAELSAVSKPDFSSVADLLLFGSAVQAGSSLRLTCDGCNHQAGAAWLNVRKNVAAGFESVFNFVISGGGENADGLAFVIQNAGPAALGVAGAGMGYEGIPNSLAVEFDTYGEVNQISVQSLGAAPNSPLPGASLGSVFAAPFTGNGPHTARVRYLAGAGTLEVYLDNLVTPALTVPVDLDALLNLSGGGALVGFSAGTGGLDSAHEILSWNLTVTDTAPVGVPDSCHATPTPSPAATPTSAPVSPSASPTPVCCPGDADNSGGNVNANDFLAVQAAFGANNGLGGLGDADCSGGAVNANDFLAVQGNFGLSCG